MRLAEKKSFRDCSKILNKYTEKNNFIEISKNLAYKSENNFVESLK